MTGALRAIAIAAGIVAAACRPGVRAGSPCRGAPAFAPFDDHQATDGPAASAGTERGADTSEGVLDALIAWYQHHGRAQELPGAGCSFAPTCSAYARAALQRYGPIAVILIVDRLIVREHQAAGAYYPPICVAHTTRLSDAVP
jgi:putative component of membrane protein insertase Oxa1/YidC/SpoIIIJ protein YidD